MQALLDGGSGIDTTDNQVSQNMLKEGVRMEPKEAVTTFRASRPGHPNSGQGVLTCCDDNVPDCGITPRSSDTAHACVSPGAVTHNLHASRFGAMYLM